MQIPDHTNIVHTTGNQGVESQKLQITGQDSTTTHNINAQQGPSLNKKVTSSAVIQGNIDNLPAAEKPRIQANTLSSFVQNVRDCISSGKRLLSTTINSIKTAGHTNTVPTEYNENSSEIPPKEIKSILRSFGYNNEKFVKYYKKYGDQIVDSDSLLKQINLIDDKKERKSAMRSFVRFQLNLIGNEVGVEGKVKLNKESSLIKLFMNKLKGISNKARLAGSGTRHLAHLKLSESLQQYTDSHNDIPKSYIKAYENGAIISALSLDKIDYEGILKEIKNGNPVCIPTGWQGHGVEITFSNGRIAYSNRGEGTKRPGMQIYEITNPDKIDVNFLKKIIAFRAKEMGKAAQYFEQGGMQKELGLGKPEIRINQKGQDVGNCAWASATSGLQAMLCMDTYPRLNLKPLFDEIDKMGPINGDNLNRAQKIAAEFKIIIENDLSECGALGCTNEHLEKLLAPLEELINLKPGVGEIVADNKAIINCRNALEMGLRRGAEARSEAIHAKWNNEHIKKECDFFINYLGECNSKNELFSKGEEAKLLEELYRKFPQAAHSV